jgi:5-methylcytosine-specific restriction enzyme subunit McrC
MPRLVQSLELVEGIPRPFRRHELSDDMVQAIHRTGKFELEAKLFDPECAFTLTSKGIVGHVPIGKELVVRVAPKTPISNLFRMLEVAYDLKSFRLLDGTVSVEQLEDLFDRLASILANRILSRTRKGVFRDYVTENQDLPCIRGRLQLRETARGLMYGSSRIHCEFQEHTADLEDNRILLWTLWVVSGIALTRADVRARVRAAYRALSHGVSLVPILPRACVNRRYHRLNEDYQALHGICRFFLEHAGPGSKQGEHSMIPFIVNMPQLFERFIALWLQTNLEDKYQVRIQHFVALEATEKLSFKIDVVLQDAQTSKTLAVLDTKYKLGEAPLDSDLAQVVAYAEQMGVERAFLVYPSAAGGNRRVKVGRIVIEALAFDLRAVNYDEEGQRFKASLFERME